jgi:tetratricopeptide (TPR) repeat protein
VEIVELLDKFGGLFFECPALIPLAITVLTVIFAYRRYKYLWDYRGKRRFDLWGSVIAASAAVTLGLSLIGWLLYRYWGLPHPFAADQIGILIAEEPGQINPRHQQAYQLALHLCFQNNSELRDIVKVKLIQRPLPPDADAQQAEAVKIGRWLRAEFVVRPFVVEGVQKPWLTVVNPEDIFLPESNLERFSSPQLAVLETLPLPQDITQVAEVALALALSKRHSHKEAAQILADILKSKRLPEAAGSRWALELFCGNELIHFASFTAAAEYKKAIRLKPDFADAHNNLGVALAQQGQYGAAAVEYKKAIRLKPDYAGVAHNNLGVLLALQGQYDDAAAEYKKAIRLKPDYAEAHYNLGLALLTQGQYNAAAAEYKKAIRLKPDFAEAHNSLGLALVAQGQYGAAAVEFKEAIRLKPDFADAHSNLGGALIAQGQYVAAAEEFKKAIRLKPDYAEAHYNLGVALGKQGQYAAAVAEFKEAIRLKPDFAEAYYNLGVALGKQGQHAAAAEEFKEAAALSKQ